MKTPFQNEAVEERFLAYNPVHRSALLDMRERVFAVHASLDRRGELVETLKWNQPSFLVQRPKQGSTLRLGVPDAEKDAVSFYFTCSTTLVPTFRELYGDELSLIGNRELRLENGHSVPSDMLDHCIALALTYGSDLKR